MTQLGERIKARLRLFGYWKKGRPDLARFCREKGYRHQYLYAWMKGRVPGQRNLVRLARDLETSMAWLLFGKQEIAEADVAVALRAMPEAGARRLERGVTSVPRSQAPQEPSRATSEALPRQARIIGLLDYQLKRLRNLTERLAEAEVTTRALQEAAGSLAGTLDPAQAADGIVSNVLRLLRVRRSVLYRFDPTSGALVCVAAAGEHGSGEWVGRVLDIGEGVVGRALLERRPIYTSRLLSDPSIVVPEWLVEVSQADGVQSALGVPLSVGGEVVGALGVGDGSGREFTEEEIDLLSAFAGHAAVTIQNARLYAETERRRQEAEKLAELGRLISQSLDPEEVGQKIVESVLGLLGLESGVLLRLMPETGVFRVLAVSGELERLFRRNAIFPAGSGVAEVAVRERQPVVTPDVLADPRITLAPEGRARAEQATCRAVLAVPLIVHDRVIGVLSVAGATGRLYSSEEIRLAQVFADQAALALENALLHEEISDSRDILRAVAANAEAPLIATDVKGRITYVSSEVERILGYRAAEVVGRPAADFYGSGLEEAPAIFGRLLAGGRIKNYETAIRTRDGGWLGVSMSITLLRDESDAVIGTLGIIEAVKNDRL